MKLCREKPTLFTSVYIQKQKLKRIKRSLSRLYMEMKDRSVCVVIAVMVHYTSQFGSIPAAKTLSDFQAIMQPSQSDDKLARGFPAY